jgi:hypothetical protein
VLFAMTRAVADGASARDAICHLGPRPYHKQVDAFRELLLLADAGDKADADTEEKVKELNDEKVAASREVVRLDEDSRGTRRTKPCCGTRRRSRRSWSTCA